jgi:hypothetical protein
VRQEPAEDVGLDGGKELHPLDTGRCQPAAPLPALQLVYDFRPKQDLSRQEGELEFRLRLLQLPQSLDGRIDHARGGGVVVPVEAHGGKSL